MKIHSHSASDPADPDSLAGRWLANGAFIYFGAMNEPYLPAFRTPALVAEEIAQQVPLSVAVRQSPIEPFGNPWRLLYVGDPLFFIKKDAVARDTPTAMPAALAHWPVVEAEPVPAPSATDPRKLDWAYASLLSRSRAGAGRYAQGAQILAMLETIHRERLEQEQIVLYDALLIALMDEPACAAESRARLLQIPRGAQTPLLRRRLESLRTTELARAIAGGNLENAADAWSALIESGPPPVIATMLTARVAAIAPDQTHLRLWRDRLRTTLQSVRSEPAAVVVEQELKRVEALLGL
jgi:hypothetical protein